MGLRTIRIPVLVREIRQKENHYFRLQPVFLPYPAVQGSNLASAEKHFREIIRTRLRNFRLQPDNQLEWLWYNFLPDYRIKDYPISITYGNRHLHGTLNAVIFQLQGLCFVCLPTLQNYMFLAGEGTISDFAVGQKIPTAVRTALAIVEQEIYGFAPESIFCTGREHIQIFQQSVALQLRPPVGWRSATDSLMQLLSEEEELDGYNELYRTCLSLTDDVAHASPYAYYRDDAVTALRRMVFGSQRRAVAVIGPRGAGRHAILQEAIRQEYWRVENSNEENYPGAWLLFPDRVVAGMSILGAWQKRLSVMIDALLHNDLPQATPPDLLVVDNPVALLRVGKSQNNQISIGDMLVPYLENRQLPLVLLATPEEWQILLEKAPGFCQYFSLQQLESVSHDLALKMLIQRRRELEERYEVDFSIYALQTLYELYLRHGAKHTLPGGLMDIAEDIARRLHGKAIGENEVLNQYAALTGLRTDWLDRMQAFDPEQLRRRLLHELIGQPRAVAALVGTVELLKARLQRPDRPVATLLFAGPTGSGKTHASKLLCRHLTGSEKALVRFDMNEYTNHDAVTRLVGSYQQPEGQLIEQVRKHPFVVLLFDEIEKAHPDVIHLLLQVLDEGRLTDSIGRTVIFTNSIIILTSNAGAERVGQRIGGFGSEQAESRRHLYRSEIERTFPPEFINRLHEIVIFDEPSFDDILQIARLQIDQWLRRDGFVRRTTVVNLSRAALEWVARRGYQPKMGGRALVRQIENDLTTLSAEQLVNLRSEQPIILNIELVKGQLRPTLIPLALPSPQPLDWVPTVYRRFYRNALDLLRRLERQLREHNPEVAVLNAQEQQHNWQYYAARERLNDLRDDFELRNLDNHDDRAFTTPIFRFKYRKSLVLQDVFSEEGLQGMRRFFQTETPYFDRRSAPLVKDYIDLGLAFLHVEWLLTQQYDQAVLRIEPLVTGVDEAEIKRLRSRYQELLQSVGATVEQQADGGLYLEGHGIRQLLRREMGIHLFTLTQAHIVPIRIAWADKREEDYQVVRFYDDAITYDVHTGLFGSSELNTDEWRMLLFSTIDPTLRYAFAQSIR